MYVISIFVLIIISALTLKLEGTTPAAFIDAPSFVFVVLICLPFLASTGLLKDFNNAFKFAVKTKMPIAKKELKRSITAVSFVIKVLWAAGIFWTVFSLINAFGGGRAIAQEKVTAHLAVMVLPMLYASFFVLLLLPIKVRLELRLQEPKPQKPKKTKNPKKQNKPDDSRRQQ